MSVTFLFPSIDGYILAVVGLEGAQDPKRLETVLERFTAILESRKYAGKVLIHNEGVQNDVEAARAKGLEGTNEGRAAFAKPEDVFTVQVPKRSVGITLADELYRAYLALFDLPTPEDKKKAKEARILARKAAWEKRVLERLRGIAQDEKLRRVLPKGTLDGFLRAEEEGTTETTPAPRPSPHGIQTNRY